MKKLAIVLLAIVFILPTLTCCAAEPKKEAPKQEQAQAEPSKTVSKEATLKDLQAQQLALTLRLEGAMAVQKTVNAMVDNARVDLEVLNRKIVEMSPKPKAEEKK